MFIVIFNVETIYFYDYYRVRITYKTMNALLLVVQNTFLCEGVQGFL